MGKPTVEKAKGKMKWAKRQWLKRLERKKRKKEVQQE